MTRNPVQKERLTDLGATRIHNDVLASIASIAAGEIRGVYRLGGGSAWKISNLLNRPGSTRGIKIVSNDMNEMKLAISVIVEYGVNIPRVADEVQENIKRQVEKMTGLVLQEVNVDVEGVHMAGPSTPKGGNT